jgi:ABC-type Fe3+-siderophore transport system permease subunit
MDDQTHRSEGLITLSLRRAVVAMALGAALALAGPAVQASAQACVYPCNTGVSTTTTAPGTVLATVVSLPDAGSATHGGGTLAFTGSDLFRLILLALILTTVGTAIYRVTRRRDTAH